jgi:hypothetical protein
MEGLSIVQGPDAIFAQGAARLDHDKVGWVGQSFPWLLEAGGIGNVEIRAWEWFLELPAETRREMTRSNGSKDRELTYNLQALE